MAKFGSESQFGFILSSVAASMQPTAWMKRKRAPTSGPSPLNRSKNLPPVRSYEQGRALAGAMKAAMKAQERKP